MYVFNVVSQCKMPNNLMLHSMSNTHPINTSNVLLGSNSTTHLSHATQDHTCMFFRAFNVNSVAWYSGYGHNFTIGGNDDFCYLMFTS